MNLNKIAVKTKVAEVEFPGIDGFKVKIAAITRTLSKKLKEDSEITTIDKKHRVPVKEINEDIFVEKFAELAIKGWSGLKYKHLPDLMLVDLTDVEDVEDLVEYSQENAVSLLSNSPTFDTWINDQVFDLEQFRN